MAANDLYLGTWILLPELCIYEAGVAPARGTYDIRETGDRLEFSITRIDARTLDSEALLGRRVLAYARRVASSDGSLLAVVQEVRLPEGRGPRNFQVYRRA